MCRSLAPSDECGPARPDLYGGGSRAGRTVRGPAVAGCAAWSVPTRGGATLRLRSSAPSEQQALQQCEAGCIGLRVPLFILPGWLHGAVGCGAPITDIAFRCSGSYRWQDERRRHVGVIAPIISRAVEEKEDHAPIRGRGAAGNPPNRFEAVSHVRDSDWTDLEDPAPGTHFLKDTSKSI